MAKVTFRVEGLAELVDGLNELPTATSNNIQKRALTEAGKPIQADAQSAAPVRTGLLRRGITVSSKLSAAQKRKHKAESKNEIFVGPPSMARGIVAEFGSVKQTPKPFMRPAWDKNKRTAFTKLRDILADEIEKARKRALRKSERFLTRK